MKISGEYLRTVLLIVLVLGGAAVAMEVPAVDAGGRWAMHGLLELATQNRWATDGGAALVLAAVAVGIDRAEGRKGVGP